MYTNIKQASKELNADSIFLEVKNGRICDDRSSRRLLVGSTES